MHWGKHHRTYVTNLNNQLKDKPLANKALEEVCALVHSTLMYTPLSLLGRVCALSGSLGCLFLRCYDCEQQNPFLQSG